MTIAEAKKAFRQKGVTRRLISDVDMDDFLLSFSNEFYNSNSINRKDIPNTNFATVNLAKFLNSSQFVATNGQQDVQNNQTVSYGIGSTSMSARDSLNNRIIHSTGAKTKSDSITKTLNRDRSGTILSSKGRRRAFDENSRTSGIFPDSSSFDISNDQKLLVAIQDGLEYVYQMQTGANKSSSPRVSPRISPRDNPRDSPRNTSINRTSINRIERKPNSPPSRNSFSKKKTSSPVSKSASGNNSRKKNNSSGISNAASTPLLRSLPNVNKKQYRSSKGGFKSNDQPKTIVRQTPPRRKPPPVPTSVTTDFHHEKTVQQNNTPNISINGNASSTVQSEMRRDQEENQRLSDDPVSNLVYQILGPPPPPL